MSVPNIKEVEWAIAELEQSESSFSNYGKLADLYIVRREMQGTPEAEPQVAAYSETVPVDESLGAYGDSEFLQAIAGKDSAGVWNVINELMDTLNLVNPKVYDSVMRKLSRL